MKRFAFAASLLMILTLNTTAISAQAQTSAVSLSSLEVSVEHGKPEKSKLRILFVGNDPNAKVSLPGYLNGEAAQRMPELMKERMSAFRTLLESHFESVKTLNAEDYKVEMSDDYDVTVFDALPPKIREVDEGEWTRPIRMTLDFDRPALMVGEVGPVTLGRHGIGLRLDHL